MLFLKTEMRNFQITKALCFVVVLLFCGALQAQTRSTNIQTLDGKKYYIHKIEKSQSLYSISKLYNVSIDDLYKYNPELKQGPKAGQEIKIPSTSAISSTPAVAAPAATVTPIDTNKYLTHRIAKGETIYSITRKYNLSEKELLNYNPTLSAGMKEGQQIIVGEKGKKKAAPPKETKQVIAPREKPVNVMIDSSIFKPVLKPKKTDYKLSLILPFKLESSLALDLNELARTRADFPEVPALAVDFYLGFKRAVDSLSAPDFKVKLQLVDADEKDTVKISALCAQPDFKDLDMIFGPLYASGFKTVSKKAKESAIPIISPITRQNKILYNNIYISKTNPSQFTLMEGLADYCIDSLVNNGANIILAVLNDKDKKEMPFISAFKKYYNEKQKALGKTAKDTVTVVKGMAGIKLQYKPNVKNVIVALSAHPVFCTDLVTQLSIFAEKKDIVLCGWQTVSEMDNIDQTYLNKLQFTFPHQYNTVNLEPYKGIIEDYKKVQQSYPGEYYFIGFDIAYYYLKNLKEKGPDFVHSLDKTPMETNYMRFEFNRPDMATGFDNRGHYIFRYNDFKIRGTAWK